MKIIETSYNGYRFRSRLEARAAVLMDEAKIKYVYEPEGFVFEDGTTYLPDFYLPDMDTYLECKGVMHDKDMHKIMMLAKETGKEIIIFEPDLAPLIGFYSDDVSFYFPNEDHREDLIIEDAFIGKCHKCKRVFFGSINGSWLCRCCGYYDGDSGFDWLFDYENNPDDYEPIKKARSKRFEFGEAGAKHA